MIIVGLTGGIGSGKTTVARMFEALDVPVYIADVEAKRLTNTSKVIRRKMIQLLGRDAYTEEGLNRAFVAQRVFNDQQTLEKINAIIHPKVRRHFLKWAQKQDTPYCIKEAAILFESGGHEQCDVTILVTAPEDVRIKRVMQRDGSSKQEIASRMKHQWPDAKKRELADYIIENISLEETQNQVKSLHQKFMARQ